MATEQAEAPVSALQEPDDEVTPGIFAEKQTQQLTFQPGGKAPTASTLSFTGGAQDVDDEFKKDEEIIYLVTAKVGDVNFHDETDRATGQVVGCVRQHKAKITGVHRVDPGYLPAISEILGG